jgi:hypothetical protein
MAGGCADANGETTVGRPRNGSGWRLPSLIGITRALGITAGSCLFALFLYLMLALPGVLSDLDSIVAPTTVLWAQR